MGRGRQYGKKQYDDSHYFFASFFLYNVMGADTRHFDGLLSDKTNKLVFGGICLLELIVNYVQGVH